MNPVKKISLPYWMPDEALGILEALNDAQNNSALFVGGCVRNTLLDECKTDIDIATTYTPEESSKILFDAGIKIIPTGLKHGTITAIKNNISCEVTTLRQDVETDGRHAVVEFSNDWEMDARRRDFTMNALYMDASGNIFDPLAQALTDAMARHVRFVGDADKRIREDYLRILRFFRFHAQYGKGDLNKKDIQACKNNSEGIGSLSRERITQEFLKLIETNCAPEVLNAMFNVDILKEIKGKNYQLSYLKNIIVLQNKYKNILKAESIVLARYFILSGGKASFHDDILSFSKAQANFIIKLDAMAQEAFYYDEKTIKKSMIRHGRSIVFQGYLSLIAQEKIDNQSSIFELITKWEIPDCPITGEALIKEGYKTSPELGQELERRKEEWLSSII